MARLSLPSRRKSYFVYWIKVGKNKYIGPYGKREWAEKVKHKGHKVVRRKRGNSPA